MRHLGARDGRCRRGPSAGLLVDALNDALVVAVALGYLTWQHGTDGGWQSLTNVAAPDRRDAVVSVGGVAGLFALLVGFGTLSDALGIATAPSPGHRVESPVVFLAGLVATPLLQAPAEELLSRRVVLDGLAEPFGLASAVLSAVFFALPRALSYAGQGAGVALLRVFLGGVLLGAVSVRTDNLLVPILVHAGYNGALDVLIQAGLYS